MSIAFNPTYYLQNNPDVLQGILQGVVPDALTHFNMFGFSEGRNPNATFDVNFYLIANPDVLAARVNPLTHFLEYGASEGRAPSATFVTAADFDTAAYAAANSDLAAAGLTTPAQLYAHFATFGFAESRPGTQTTAGVAIGANGVAGAPADDAPVIGSTFTLTTAIAENIEGTPNIDVINGFMDGADNTFNAGDAIDGGAGTDTFNLFTEAPGATAPAGSSVKNVEIINIISDGTGTFDTDGTDLEADYFEGATQIWQKGVALGSAITGVGAGVTIGFADTTVTGADVVTVADDVTEATVVLDDVAATSTIAFGETTAGDLLTVNVSGSIDTAGGALTIDVTTGGAATVETVNLALTEDTVLTFTDTTPTIETIDASESTGDLTMDTDFDNLSTLKTILSGSGDDTIITNGTVDETVDAGAGMDAITITAGSATTIIINEGDTGLTLATADDITGFVSGTDKLDFNLADGSATNFIDGGDSSSFTDALTNANTAFDGTVQYFFSNDGTDGWLFVDRDLDGTADEGIELSGVTALAFGDIIA